MGPPRASLRQPWREQGMVVRFMEGAGTAPKTHSQPLHVQRRTITIFPNRINGPIPFSRPTSRHGFGLTRSRTLAGGRAPFQTGIMRHIGRAKTIVRCRTAALRFEHSTLS